jgi:hypothetical protein
MTTTAAVPFPVAAGTRLLGEVISWTCSGVTVTHPALLAALRDAALDPGVARELAPKHAFTRAAKKLSDQRIIRQVAEDESTVKFQFTAEHRSSDRIEYELETMLSLNKATGKVSSDLPGLATLAQEHLDHAIDARTGADVTRVIQKLFDMHADLFPVRPQGGVYFVPERHAGFVDRVQSMLGRINGLILRFPVPAGTPEGDRSVKESVAAGLSALLDEYRSAVAGFDDDTRKGTVERAAAKIRTVKFKVEAYAELLADEKARLERGLADAQRELRAKVEALADAPVGA